MAHGIYNPTRNAAGKLVVYHGTSANFRRFNLKKTAMGTIWFSSDKETILSGDAGAEGRDIILTLEVDLKNPAGWDEYERLMLVQIKAEGYDGVILPRGDGGQFDGFVFDPKQVKIIKRETTT